MDKQQITIGITMRVQQSEYGEWRDALAHDWYRFMDWCFPEYVSWIPVPNLGSERVQKFVRQHAISGIILSGGNDIGSCPLRDESETALIEYARLTGIPLLGVCRGLQLIWQFYGGQLRKVDEKKHVVTRHKVILNNRNIEKIPENMIREVNSFHRYGLEPGTMKNLESFAHSDDGEIEGIIDIKNSVLALMWHPERETSFSELDQQLLHWLFLRK